MMIIAPPVKSLIHLRKLLTGCTAFFHFGIENGKDQLKNTTGRAEVAKYLGGQEEEVVGWQISG